MSGLPALPVRQPDTHKGRCGHVLVIAGSTGMTGAGALASMAALRAGAGLVTWAVGQRINNIAELLCLEVMTLPVPDAATGAPGVDAREHLLEASCEASAVLLGPGLPVAGETGELIRLLVPEIHAPLVLDAGALMAVGSDRAILRKRRAATVITPHPGEMARMCGTSNDGIQSDRTRAATEFSNASGVITVLKGHGTVITDGTTTAINQTGNPGMATAGAGDVLAGLIAGLLAQGMSAFDAARLGVHLHGLAGDIAAGETGWHGLIASDILATIPEAFLTHAASTATEA